MLTLVLVAITAWSQEKKRPTDEQRGKELYDRHCLACHGAGNRGDGPATTSLVFPVPDLQGKVETGKPGIDLVQYGRGPMPAYEATFDVEDTKRVLAYMASLPRPQAKPPPSLEKAPKPPAPPGAPPDNE